MRYWEHDALDAPQRAFRVVERTALASVLLREAAVSDAVVILHCIAALSDVQVRSLLQTLHEASDAPAAAAPLLGAGNRVVLPLPHPNGGWVGVPRARRAQLTPLVTLELSESPVVVLASAPIWMSGIAETSPSGVDDVLAGLRARGYRLHVDAGVVVETDLGAVRGTAGSFPADLEQVSDLRRIRLEETLERVQHKVRASAATDLALPRVLIDARGIQGFFNGTQQLAMALLDHYLLLNPRAHVLLSDDARSFHGLDRRWGPQAVSVPDWEGRYDHAFRIDQPWSWSDLHLLHAAAPTVSMYFLDVIAWDTAPASAELRDVWASVATDADGLLFLSETSRARFADAFPIRPTMCQSILYPSLDPSEYREAHHSSGGHRDIDVLVIGNSYAHKDLGWATKFIQSAFPQFVVETVGGSGSVAGARTTFEVAELYARAKRVVYPSHYEGFGLPLLEALAYGATVIARETPVNRELVQRLGPARWHSFRDADDLLHALSAAEPITGGGEHGASWTWSDAGRALQSFFADAMQAYDPSRSARRARAGARD